MAAVSSSSSFYSCYCCLAYSPPLLLQSSTIPQADVGNTDVSASLIWINSMKERRGAGRCRANGRPLCISISTGGGVWGGQRLVQSGETMWRRCCHIHDVHHRERRGGFAQPIEPDGISLQKANTKRPHNQQLAFWGGGTGSHTFIHTKSSHLLLRLLHVRNLFGQSETKVMTSYMHLH